MQRISLSIQRENANTILGCLNTASKLDEEIFICEEDDVIVVFFFFFMSVLFWKNKNQYYFCFRLYETQVKKIVKVQCMMRTFLARKRVAPKLASRQASRDSADGKFSRGCSVDVN